MRQFIWEIDEFTTIIMQVHWLGFKFAILLNGVKIPEDKLDKTRSKVSFTTPEGKTVSIFYRYFHLWERRPKLTLDGIVYFYNEYGAEKKCDACGKQVKMYEKACPTCAKELPTANEVFMKKMVRDARNVMIILVALFGIRGLLLSVINLSNHKNAIVKLEQMEQSKVLDQKIGGKLYTAGSLKEELQKNKFKKLWPLFVPALIYFALAIWARKNPLAANVVGAAIFLLLILQSMVKSPFLESPNGSLLNLFILSILIKGVRAGVRLRELDKLNVGTD